MIDDWDKYRPYFRREEFDSPDKPGSGDEMQPECMDKLYAARHIAGVPFVVNSGYRTEQHNADVGGVPNSPHRGGWAADISAPDGEGRRRWVIRAALAQAGFTRIGEYPWGYHADCDPTKAERVSWCRA